MRLNSIIHTQTFKLFVYTIFILLTFTMIFMFFNHEYWNGITPQNDRTLFDKIVNRLYFTSTTLSTIGYGDITPKTNITKILVIFLQLVILITVITPTLRLIHL